MPLTIYRSSAGSGKTFTLVKEYLKLVLKNPFDYKHILAITFTVKATEEMKSRIVDELTLLANGKPSEYKPILLRELNKPSEEIRNNARVTLTQILHNYSRFEISTIDSFFTRIVRSFAKELQLPMRYEVDMDTNKALDEAIEGMYKLIPENKLLTTWLEEFSLRRLEEGGSWNIDFQIEKIGEELFKEKFFEVLKKKDLSFSELQSMVGKLWKAVKIFENRMQQLAQEAQELLDQYNLEESMFRKGSVQYLTNTILNKKEYEPTATFRKIANGDMSWYAKTSDYQSEIDEAAHNGLNALATDVWTYYEKHQKHYYSCREVLKNIYSYGILNILNQQLKLYRDEHNIMLLSDMNFLIQEIVSDQDAPFIFEKVGSRYKHILIDEFQDTSNYQWRNLAPLVKNVLAENNNVLLVGDVKQSVYRWRGGNMNLLLSGVQEELAHFPFRPEVLGQNWRSAQNIVLFNNSFFELAKTQLQRLEVMPSQQLILESYEGAGQMPRKEIAGYVEARFFEDIKTENEDGEWEKVTWKQQSTERAVEQIRLLMEEGFTAGDILILTERNSEATDMASALLEQEIEVISKSSTLLSSSPPVQFIIQLLRYLYDFEDSLTRARLLHHYYQIKERSSVSSHDLYSSHISIGVDPGIEKWMSELSKTNCDKWTQMPLYELLEELLIVFELNKASDNYIQRLQDVVLELLGKGINSIGGFLEWWEEHYSELTILHPENQDAVTVMTVHRSKGLEAPVVIIPYANFRFLPKGLIWTEELSEEFEAFSMLPLTYTKKLGSTHFENAYRQESQEGILERFNLAYVAFTRPQERLYVYSQKFKTSSTEINSLSRLMHAVFSDPEFPYSDCWDGEEWVLTIGDCASKSDKKPEETTMVQHMISDVESIRYQDRINIRAEAVDFFRLFDNQIERRIREGLIIHTVLERLERVDEVKKVAEQMLQQGFIDEAYKLWAIDKVEELMTVPQFKEWFNDDWEVLAECEISLKGKLYKPDRVLLRGKQAVIIDYKRAAHASNHARQVKQYAEALKNMGYQNIEGYLLYTQSLEIVKVEL